MLIERRSTDLGGIRPSVVAFLKSLPASASSHDTLGLRPPHGSYNASLQRLVTAFENVLSAHAELVTSQAWIHDKVSWNAEFVPAQEHLLYVLFEHVEHCRDILRCFSLDDAAFGKQKDYQGIRRGHQRLSQARRSDSEQDEARPTTCWPCLGTWRWLRAPRSANESAGDNSEQAYRMGDHQHASSTQPCIRVDRYTHPF